MPEFAHQKMADTDGLHFLPDDPYYRSASSPDDPYYLIIRFSIFEYVRLVPSTSSFVSFNVQGR